MNRDMVTKELVDKIEAEAHGCGELRLTKLTDEQLKKWKAMIEREPSHIHIEMDSPVRPLPCVRDEHGEIKEQTVKQLLQKINEELDELKAVVLSVFYGLGRRHDNVNHDNAGSLGD